MPTMREGVECTAHYLAARPMFSAASRREFDNGFDAALRDYGEYEIVEGRLGVSTFWPTKSRVEEVRVDNYYLGVVGDHIKLLVPPEKKRKPPLEWKQVMPPYRPPNQPSTREKRLEAALEEIATRAEVALYLRAVARRALEED